MSKIDNENNSKIEKSQGFLLIDKPAGITSHDVVDHVRRLLQPLTSNLQPPKVGHAGTLDPFATGLLIVGVGRMATREMQKLVGLDKEYEAVFVLGASSTTDDTEGEITPAPIDLEGSRGLQPAPDRRLEPAATAIEEATKQFIGEIEQVPPTYCAIKVGGKKMYEAAREGKPIEGKPRQVTIYTMELLPSSLRGSTPKPRAKRGGTEAIFQRIASSVDDKLPPRNDEYRVSLRIHCSSGTYIRSLARDLGRALGGGGYVEQLRRTSIGPFSVKEAVTLDELGSRGLQPAPDRRLKPAATIPVPDFLAKL